MKKFLLCLLLWPCLGFAAPDLTTAAGFDRTCTSLPKDVRKLKDNADKQAFVVCQDVALLTQMITWGKRGLRDLGSDANSERLAAELRKELTLARDELAKSRSVLAGLRLRPQEGLLLVPGAWRRDLDGDGSIAPWESHFFAIPKRGDGQVAFRLPSNDPAYYDRHYQLDARIRLDQSDILWALSYHQFAEGLVEMLLAHRWNPSGRGAEFIELRDPTALLRAHRLIGQGISTSERMRLSLLAETDDADEWIPNPRQRHSVFPLELDAEAFGTWGELLRELARLWDGKTLLQARGNAAGLLGGAARVCPADQGLNVSAVFRQPARFPLVPNAWRAACRTPDRQHPPSTLTAMLDRALERGRADPRRPDWQFVRYLYWVN